MPQVPALGLRGTARRLPSGRFQGALLFSLGLLAVCGNWRPGYAESRPKIKELDLAPKTSPISSGGGVCGAAQQAGYLTFDAVRLIWAQATAEGIELRELRNALEGLEKGVLSIFDRELQAQGGQSGDCSPQRAALIALIRKEVLPILLAQRVITERAASDQLRRKLVAQMKKRGGPLREKEKMDVLKLVVEDYKTAVEQLLPEWASIPKDEEAEAERRLGALQFLIEDTPEGRSLKGRWAQDRLDNLMRKRAHGMSVSLDPSLRVMIRPNGLGNLQVYSVGPMGPPNSPATVNVGILNDGSIADVYREHPEPPKIALQPAVKVNLNLR